MQSQPQSNVNFSTSYEHNSLDIGANDDFNFQTSLENTLELKGRNPISPNTSEKCDSANLSREKTTKLLDDLTYSSSGNSHASSTSKQYSISRSSSPLRRVIGDQSGSKCKSPVFTRRAEAHLTPLSADKSKAAVLSDGEIAISKDPDKEGKCSNVSFNGSSDLSGEPPAGDGAVTPLRCLTEADDPDSSGALLTPPNHQHKTKEFFDQINQKIQKTTKLIELEQRFRDDNVNEYLKLSNNADRQQLVRIKTVFEKKNQKSAATIQHLQKKLENYHRKKREAEQFGVPGHRQPKEVLRDVSHGLKSVGGNIRDGITGLSGKGLIGKPKEIAYLIRNKFGSADNIKELEDGDKCEARNHHGSATLPPNSGLHPTSSSIQLSSIAKTPISSGTMGSSGGGGGSSGGGKLGSDEGGDAASDCNSSMTSESVSGPAHQLVPTFSSPHDHGNSGYDSSIWNSVVETWVTELKERQEENIRLKEEIDTMKQMMSTEMNQMFESYMEEKLRSERLEEQVNDLTELHQNEMENLKTAIKDIENMEEKVQYKNEENIKDLYELVDGVQAKISRMEHQQAQQQQQFLTLEGLENSNARALFVKLINILLIFLQVLLLVVATVAGILTPLLQTKTRLLTTIFLCLFCVAVYLQLSEIRSCWFNVASRITGLFS